MFGGNVHKLRNEVFGLGVKMGSLKVGAKHGSAVIALIGPNFDEQNTFCLSRGSLGDLPACDGEAHLKL